MKDKHWKVVNSRRIHEGKWINYDIDDIKLADGKMIEFEAIRYKMQGAGAIAEGKDGRIILVRNYRYITDTDSWEVPAGTVKGEKPEDTIIHEMLEEAGCRVEKKDMTYIGNYLPVVGSTNLIFHAFHIKNVEQTEKHTDTNEIIESKWFTKDELIEMLKKGEIRDGLTNYALMKYFGGFY